MKKLSSILSICLLSLVLLTCSDKWVLEKKLDNFLQLLDQQTTSYFKNGQLSQVVSYIEEKSSDPNFKKEYLDLKKNEAINLFNDQQTVEFFYHSVYKKINKPK